VVYRPFRQITLELDNLSGSKKAVSYIDEQLASRISDSDHRFLLWRPRLADAKIKDEEFGTRVEEDVDSVKEVIDDLILQRWNGQELDEELRPKLRSLQADPLTSIAFIIPRSPHGLKREETILADRKEIHSFILASSLVTNSSPKDVMLSAQIGERVLVRTIIAVYQNLSSSEVRHLCLETTGSSSLQDASKAGGALTRICELYPNCIELITQSYLV